MLAIEKNTGRVAADRRTASSRARRDGARPRRQLRLRARAARDRAPSRLPGEPGRVPLLDGEHDRRRHERALADAAARQPRRPVRLERVDADVRPQPRPDPRDPAGRGPAGARATTTAGRSRSAPTASSTSSSATSAGAGSCRTSSAARRRRARARPFPTTSSAGRRPDDAHRTGVVLRLNDDGTAPADNPFFAAGAAMGGEVGAEPPEALLLRPPEQLRHRDRPALGRPLGAGERRRHVQRAEPGRARA